jgi:hypothetical protein
MNMAIRGLPRRSATKPGIDFNFGKEPANSFTQDQHPALPGAVARAQPRSHTTDRPGGRINPPFKIKEWCDARLKGGIELWATNSFSTLRNLSLLTAA